MIITFFLYTIYKYAKTDKNYLLLTLTFLSVFILNLYEYFIFFILILSSIKLLSFYILELVFIQNIKSRIVFYFLLFSLYPFTLHNFTLSCDSESWRNSDNRISTPVVPITIAVHFVEIVSTIGIGRAQPPIII